MRVETSSSGATTHQDTGNITNKSSVNESWLDAMTKQILENRAGIDSKKIDEIEAKIEALKNDKSISPEERKKMIAALEQEKKELLEQFARETAEKEKGTSPTMALSWLNRHHWQCS